MMSPSAERDLTLQTWNAESRASQVHVPRDTEIICLAIKQSGRSHVTLYVPLSPSVSIYAWWYQPWEENERVQAHEVCEVHTAVGWGTSLRSNNWYSQKSQHLALVLYSSGPRATVSGESKARTMIYSLPGHSTISKCSMNQVFHHKGMIIACRCVGGVRRCVSRTAEKVLSRKRTQRTLAASTGRMVDCQLIFMGLGGRGTTYGACVCL